MPLIPSAQLCGASSRRQRHPPPDALRRFRTCRLRQDHPLSPRRTELVFPLQEDDPRVLQGRIQGHSARLHRVRKVRQVHRLRELHPRGKKTNQIPKTIVRMMRFYSASHCFDPSLDRAPRVEEPGLGLSRLGRSHRPLCGQGHAREIRLVGGDEHGAADRRGYHQI